VRKLCLIALLSVVAILSDQPAALFIPKVHASAAPVGASPSKKKNKTRKSKKQMILEGQPRRLCSTKVSTTTLFAGGQIPKRGTWRLPVLALFIFAVAALKSASGGTHRVRGVVSAVCVLSPVESTSPPC